MTGEPTNSREAMNIVLSWIEAAAKDEGLDFHIDCLPTFRSKNQDQFDDVFSETFWKESKKTLKMVAGLYGTMCAHVERIRDPSATRVSFAVFEDVGRLIRKHCPPTTPGRGRGMRSGDWCQWP